MPRDSNESLAMTGETESNAESTVIASQRRSNPNLESVVIISHANNTVIASEAIAKRGNPNIDTVIASEKIEHGNPTQNHSESNNIQESYIAFLDSDDFWDLNALEICENILKKHSNLEAIIFNRLKVAHGGAFPQIYYPKDFEDRLHSPLDFSKLKDCYLTAAYNYIINARFLFANNINFINIYYEDVSFASEVAARLNRCFIIKNPIYNYRLSPNSLTRGKINLQKRLKMTYARYILAKFFIQMAQFYKLDKYKVEFFHAKRDYEIKKLLENLQFIGYHKDLGFSQQDLDFIKDFIAKKRKYCIKYPRIYGLPKRIKYFFKAHKPTDFNV